MTEALLHTWLLWTWLVLSPLVFAVLLLVTAPYGRHTRSGWGPVLPATWAWVIMESPAVLAMGACYLAAPPSPALVPLLLLCLWQLHYLHRAFIYPFRLRGTDRRMPLTVVILGITFNVINAYLNGRWLTVLGPPYPAAWILDTRFILGCLLFAGGMVLNLQSDRILLGLRGPGEGGYRIPQGGAFCWVSSPNYLGEMLEWSGWALATWSLPGLAFAVWTAANLVPRALSHHRWYRQTFPDYPPGRRALFPFLL